MQEQSYATHSRRPPTVYLVGAGLATLWLVLNVVTLVRFPSVASVGAVVGAIALLCAIWSLRTHALTVQDRVIRLEEQVRLTALLPADLRGRLGEIGLRQLIALRFASDAEVEGLVRRVLAGELVDAKSIKRAVRDWRGDHQRV